MAVVIPGRFNGPAASGNGGYSCAVFARAVTGGDRGGAVVTLRTPPPLDTALTVEHDGDGGRILHGGTLVAEAAPSPTGPGAWPVPPAVPPATAREAQRRYRGHEFHPFPGCFVCGPGRPARDGLALEPGAVPGRAATVACAWEPAADLADGAGEIGAPLVWAALDCPGAWTQDLAAHPMVLGRMAAEITALPRAGEPYVVVASSAPPLGRKVLSHTALYDAEGALLASAAATWITIPSGDVPPA
ncbi:hypothetical protein EDD29_6278 [Actinocorallia herbida]|uniref:Thioesterase superfamily protein n=1 Tax=Actinocorallia herbida TaxID=58109 RepID=A0A3N1D4Z7_9ACTN|nr:hypothetical protein [Actinocorallia herbida]ROO88604.1 hypothetical protein EDD29_6278 [Actinocorallia herbida]